MNIAIQFTLQKSMLLMKFFIDSILNIYMPLSTSSLTRVDTIN
jgi:hypothetical protein